MFVAKLIKDSWLFGDNFRKISKLTANSSVKKYFLGKFSEHFCLLHTIRIINFDLVAHTKIAAKKTRQVELH